MRHLHVSPWITLGVTSALLLGGSRVAELRAQQPSLIQGPSASILFSADITPKGDTSVPNSAERVPPSTHWKQGLLIGGLIGAVGFGGLLYGLCEGLKETQESCLGSGLGGAAIGAVIGGTVGALVGGQFYQDSVPADSAKVP
jgi:hypothetical protein